MAQIFLNKKISTRIANGNPLIFHNEIGDIIGHYNNGDIVEVFSSNGSFIGKGYINNKSQIKVRLLTREIDQSIDYEFIKSLIQAAHQRRVQLGFKSIYRLVNDAMDNLSGLVIDRYEDTFVLQLLTLGMEMRRDWIVKAINELFDAKNIVERSDVSVRKLEGLSNHWEVIQGDLTAPITATVDDLKVNIDVLYGQRTGYFLEYKSVNEWIRRIAPNKRILDVFSYTGQLGLVGLTAGATSLTAVEYDEKFVNLAKENAALNGFESQIDFKVENAFDYLKHAQLNGEIYDIVILDPPTFAPTINHTEKALAAYKEINLRAMKLLPKSGGLIITTLHGTSITHQDFIEMLTSAGKDAKRQVQQLDIIGLTPDFPVMWTMINSNHFKAFVLQVI